MQQDVRTEIIRLVVALFIAVAITMVWLGAVLHPDRVTETRAELWQAMLGVVLVVIDLLLFIYAIRRLRHATSQTRSGAQRRIEVTDNSASMHGGEQSTQVYARGSVRTNSVWGTQVQIQGSATMVVLLVALLGVAVVSLTIIAIMSLRQLDLASTAGMPPVPAVKAVPGESSTVQAFLELTPSPGTISTVEEPARVAQSADQTTPTAVEDPLLLSAEDSTEAAAATSATQIAEATPPPTETFTPQPLPTATFTLQPTPTTIDVQATVQTLVSLYATQTALAAPTTPPVAPTPRPTIANTPRPVSPTNTPVPPARTYTAPQLIAPPSGSAFESGQTVTLQWNSVGTLAPDNHYLLAVQHLGGSEWRVTDDLSWQVAAWMTCPQLPDGCTWWVAVVQGAEVGGYPQAPGQVVSAASNVWRFGVSQPSGGDTPPPGGGEPPSPTPPLVITPDS